MLKRTQKMEQAMNDVCMKLWPILYNFLLSSSFSFPGSSFLFFLDCICSPFLLSFCSLFSMEQLIDVYVNSVHREREMKKAVYFEQCSPIQVKNRFICRILLFCGYEFNVCVLFFFLLFTLSRKWNKRKMGVLI